MRAKFCKGQKQEPEVKTHNAIVVHKSCANSRRPSFSMQDMSHEGKHNHINGHLHNGRMYISYYFTFNSMIITV